MLSIRRLLNPRIPHRRLLSYKPRFGQPTFETHPHIVGRGEVTPGISALEYATRRSALAASLPPGSVAVVPSADIKYRSGVVFYPFHQSPDFLYLTGFLEPSAVCVIEKTGGDDGRHVFHMLVREKNARAELWDGARSGVQAAMDVFNADEAADIELVEEHLKPILSRASGIYTDAVAATRPSTFAQLVSPRAPPPAARSLAALLHDRPVSPLKRVMHKLRVHKSAAEIANMRLAGKVSGEAFNQAMGMAARKEFPTEKQLWAFLEYEFRRRGCDGEAYVPVVAGGENALSIHYTRNDDVLRPQSLVLVDAGAQYASYVTDITRTFPTSSTFTSAQSALYQAVLTVQKHCVSLCRTSARASLNDIHATAESLLFRELTNIGFDLAAGGLEVLFPHHVGHYVGMDVHDCQEYDRRGWLEARIGVYVPDDDRWPKHFRGMGVRIEDCVCVGEEPDVLSCTAVKEISEIESQADIYRAENGEATRMGL